MADTRIRNSLTFAVQLGWLEFHDDGSDRIARILRSNAFRFYCDQQGLAVLATCRAHGIKGVPDYIIHEDAHPDLPLVLKLSLEEVALVRVYHPDVRVWWEDDCGNTGRA